MPGNLLAIFISPIAGAPLQEIQRVRALAGKGLEGDRYLSEIGTFSKNPGQRDVTLIESEALDLFARETGYRRLEAIDSRRNLLTQCVRLNDLVGRDFLVGNVAMRGLRLCEPCTHLARLTSTPLSRASSIAGDSTHRSLTEGELSAGDVIVAPVC